MFSRCVNAFLLAAFAAVSLLGHGGLHLLPGGHDCHGAHAATGHAHVHHGHHHACGHPHGDEQTDHSHDSAPAAPLEHDHDHCLVCQWHAQGQLAAVSVVIPMEECGCFDVALPSAQVTATFRLSRLTTRGPPQLG